MTATHQKLGDVCELVNGGAWNQTEYADDGIPVVQVSNMKNGTIDISDLKFLPPSSYDRYKKHALKEDDLVIATVGSHATQASAAGRATIVRGFAAGMLLNQNAVAIRSKSELVDQRYLGLVGRSEEFQSYLGAVGQGAANQVRIALSAIKDYRCDLPAISSQRRIVDVVFAYDDLIENNRRRIQLLEQAARLLYKEWFVHLRFPGHEHVKIKDGVPEGWESACIADIGEVITGKTPSKKNDSYYGVDIPFIKTPDMHDNIIVTQTAECLSEKGANSQSNKMLPPRSILVSCIGTVGAVAFNGASAHTNQQINAIVPRNESLRYWTFFMAKGLKPLLEGMGGGATMANVNKSKLSNIKVIIPPVLMLEQFASVLTPQFDQIEKLALMNLRLAKARSILLPRLMNGEIAV